MDIFLRALILGVTLAMDAFSLSIMIASGITKKFAIKFILIVGLMHLVLPILGGLIGYRTSSVLAINGDFIFGIILILLGIQILITIKKDDTTKIKNNFLSLFLLAFSVSFDSFSVGFGLSFSSGVVIINSIIFSICSLTFTALGLIIGKYISSYLGIYSKFISSIVLIFYGIYQIYN